MYKSSRDGSVFRFTPLPTCFSAPRRLRHRSGEWREGKRHGNGILQLFDGSTCRWRRAGLAAVAEMGCRDEWYRGVLAVRFMPTQDMNVENGMEGKAKQS